jgi:hypothetical protein
MSNYALLSHYIDCLRKPEKKNYAIAYYRYIHGFTKTEPVYHGKSYMAAQAIRMEIHSWDKLEKTMTLDEILAELRP